MLNNREQLRELISRADDRVLSIPHIGEDGAEALADYIIEDGWIKPPCKVGDTIYRLVRDGKAYKIVDCFEVAFFEINEDGIYIVDDIENYFDLDDIGRTIFFNEKEAEFALKAKQQKK